MVLVALNMPQTQPTPISVQPHDVLCGKDKTYAKHPGNVIYKTLIEENTSRYAEAATKQDRMHITKEIVSTMQHKYKSRFIKGDSFEVLAESKARDKTSHALRFAAQKAKEDASQLLHLSSQADSHRSHRRVKSESSSSSHSDSTGSPNPESVQSLYRRQQAILDNIQNEPVAAVALSALSLVDSPNQVTRPDEEEEEEEKFDTLRSQDLRDLLNEPMPEDEWGAVSVLTKES